MECISDNKCNNSKIDSIQDLLVKGTFNVIDTIKYRVTLTNNTNKKFIFNGISYNKEFYNNKNITFKYDIKKGTIIDYYSNTEFILELKKEKNNNSLLNAYLNFDIVDK